MTYYHASAVKNIEVLQPGISMHGKALVYLSNKRENTLVYLSNAIEKYCKETNFAYEGSCYKWASYGFNQDGILQLEEYYPNAVADTYQGVQAYIYAVGAAATVRPLSDIPGAFVSETPVEVIGCELIRDAYEAIMDAAAAGKIIVKKYDDMSDRRKEQIKKMITVEYENKKEIPEYIHFLKGKFPFL